MKNLIKSTQVLGYQYARSVIKGYKESKISSKETNDCTVKAIASALNESYDSAHKFCKSVLKRQDRKGLSLKELMKLSDKTYKIGDTVVDFTKLGVKRIKNEYKLKGEVVLRDKTVKSFIKSNPRGTFIVLVSGHAFSVVDGVLIDNVGEEFRPTRKVKSAFKIDIKAAPGLQLKLF